jgi:hypothetical protein
MKYADESQPLTKGDVPMLMGVMMDRLGIDEFRFSVTELMDAEGAIALDVEDWVRGSYILRRRK